MSRVTKHENGYQGMGEDQFNVATQQMGETPYSILTLLPSVKDSG